MKYIRRFNEELKSETYLSAANKLSYEHPERAKKLREYELSRRSTNVPEKEWTFMVIGDYVGTVTAKLKRSESPYSSGYFFEVIESDLKSTEYTRGDKPNITTIKIMKSGLHWGGDNIYGSCYVANRREALELKKVLSELGYELSVNDLYTERKPKQGYDYEEPRKPWYKR